MPPVNLPVAMTIATGDSSCGAGAQADLLTFAARNVYGLTAFAALTAQNPDAVDAIFELTPEFLMAQCVHNARYYSIGAMKTGMLFSKPLIETVDSFLQQTTCPVVIDPVMVATSGATLLKEDAIDTLKSLLPRATLVTPNLDEAGVLLGETPQSKEDIQTAAHALAKTYLTAFLLKGGHAKGDQIEDVLALPNGNTHYYHAQRQKAVNTHGSGCTLSAAIAAELAKGVCLTEAVASAHAYLQKGFAKPINVAKDTFIAHMHSHNMP